MSISKRKHRLQRILYSKITLAILLLCCVWLSLSVYERYTIATEMKHRRMEREADYQELQQRKANLEDKVDYLSDERGVESEIRRNFDVAKEGEEVVIIVDDDEKKEVLPLPTSTEESESEGFWSWLIPW